MCYVYWFSCFILKLFSYYYLKCTRRSFVMEEKNDKQSDKISNGITNGLSTKSVQKFTWNVNITSIDLSARNIDHFDSDVQFPENLKELNLSHNKLVEIPAIVLNLKKIKKLDLSHNAINFFVDTPKFCHTVERLNISYNKLLGPPYWIWTEKPKNLVWINISCNSELAKSFLNGYLEELLQHVTLISEIDLHNCGLERKHEELLGTFKNAKAIQYGIKKYSYHGSNVLGEIPSKGLQKCCDIEQLNLSNAHIHTINSGIAIFKNLKKLNLSCNKLNGLPDEFCCLVNLETCVLSSNNILYLPDHMYKLTNLIRLYLDNNVICALPENLATLPNLKVLDLYDNHLSEGVEDYSNLEEFDLAQNYVDEPNDKDYLEKKEKLRLMHEDRYDGSKPNMEVESEYSSEVSSNEEYYRKMYNDDNYDVEPEPPNEISSTRSSSPEDWDSDSYWVPHDIAVSTAPQNWENMYITRKLRENHFCPADAHVLPISELVKKNKYPQMEIEKIGQFDDYSSDDS